MLCALILAATALSADPAAAAQSITVSLAPRPGAGPSGCAGPKMGLAPPEGTWKLPTLTGQRPLYGVYEFRGKKLLMALDRTERSKPYYDRLWIDTNDNGDLADETPATTQQCSVAQFKDVKIPYDVNGQTRQYVLEADFYFNDQEFTSIKAVPTSLFEKAVIANLRPQNRVAGTFTVNGKTYEIEIADATADGFFNNRLQHVDPFYPEMETLSVRGDWLFLYEKTQRWEYRWMLGDLLYLDSQLYRLTVDETANGSSSIPKPAH
jgi:hypothetical protein